ncbi:hypothetical protein D3C87_1767040 [compost metagenome]
MLLVKAAATTTAAATIEATAATWTTATTTLTTAWRTTTVSTAAWTTTLVTAAWTISTRTTLIAAATCTFRTSWSFLNWLVNRLLDRQSDLAILVHVNYFDRYLVFQLQVVINVLHIIVRDLRNVNKTGNSFSKLDECSKVSNPRHSSL